MEIEHGDFRFRATFAIYYQLKGKVLPEGLRKRHAALENILEYKVPGNSWIAFQYFAEAIAEHAEEIKDLCQ